MSLAVFMKLLHVLTAFWLVSGLVGRGLTLAQAERTPDIPRMRSLLTLSGLFERFMVIPASLAVLLFGLLTAWTLGIPLLGFLQGAQSNWLLVSLLLYLSVILLVPFIFIPRGKVFGAALEEASAQGAVTANLRVAFADPAVRAAHIYEFAAIIIVLILMVTRPF
jgi:uncharacterized membrane protein